MGKNRFVTPETVRKNISDGDWIELKKRLSFGEERRLAGGAMTKMSAGADAGISVDFERFHIMRISTWLVDWSFSDEDGKPVRLTEAAISHLDPQTADEISDIITAHIEEMEVERGIKSPDEAIEEHNQAIATLEQAKNESTSTPNE